MSFFERFIERLNFEVEAPTSFGWFHLLFVALVLCAAVGCFFLRDVSSRTFRIIIGGMFSLMFILEVLKQCTSFMTFTDGVCQYKYNWSAFPFQLCSVPLYVLPLLSFLPDCNVRDCAAAFTMTYGFVAGVAVYLVPSTVFTTHLYTNIQTMIHHGIQIVSGFFVALYYRKRINRKFFFGGVALFGVVFVFANLLNTVGYDLLLSSGAIDINTKFNMFYISPREGQTIPVMSEFLKSLPSAVLIIGYFILLTVAAFIVIYIAHLINRFSERYVSKTEDPEC